MRNNKGFSLVELLAIIVVLGILITIASFTYQSILNNSKKEVYKKYEITMENAAMMFVIKNGVPNGSKVTMSDLVNNQYLDKFVDPKDSKDCPDSYVTVIANSNYSDISYNACLICNSYKTKNCVEPPKRDESKPDCFFSNPSPFNGYAGLNGTITVDLTCTDDGALKDLDTKKIVFEKDGVFEIKSISSKETITNGYKWKVTLKAKSEASGELKTKLKILKGAIKDRTNNENDEKYSANDFGIDIGKPTITYSIASGSYNKNIDLKITSVDALSGINYMDIEIYKNKVLYASYDKVKATSGELSVSRVVTLSDEGEWTVSTKAYDNVGNVQTKSQTYKIDKTKPKIEYNPTSNSYNTKKAITITSTDAGGSGLNYMDVLVKKNGVVISNKSANNITGGTYKVTIDSEGEWIIHSQAYDNAGNVKTESQTYKIDTKKPNCSFTGPSTRYIRQRMTAIYLLSCTDSNGFKASKITSSDISISSNILSVAVSSPQSIENGYQYTVTVTGNSQGSAYLTLKSGAVTDNASNGNNQVSSQVVSVDTTVPTISFDPSSGSYAGSKQITINFSDNMSGVVERNVTIVKDRVTKEDNLVISTNTYTYTLSEAGTYEIYANAVDAVGNNYKVKVGEPAKVTLIITPECVRSDSCPCENYSKWTLTSDTFSTSCSANSANYSKTTCEKANSADCGVGMGMNCYVKKTYKRKCNFHECCTP